MEEDITTVGVFYDKIVEYLDLHVNYPKWRYKDYPSEDSVRQMTSTGSQFIIEDDDRIIGAFVLNTDPQGDYDRGSWSRDLPVGSYMIIHTLAIAPEYQGRGLACEVISYCIETARKNGFKAIRLDIVPTNTPAAHLYEKNGFSYAGTVDLQRGIEGIPEFSLYELCL